jgi:hypothetical protein
LAKCYRNNRLLIHKSKTPTIVTTIGANPQAAAAIILRLLASAKFIALMLADASSCRDAIADDKA